MRFLRASDLIISVSFNENGFWALSSRSRILVTLCLCSFVTSLNVALVWVKGRYWKILFELREF